MHDAALSHRDCLNYAPIDAAQGLCRNGEAVTAADGEPCARFSRLPRCRWCVQYRCDPKKAHIGTCAASRNGFMAYADMTAKTCAQFAARP